MSQMRLKIKIANDNFENLPAGLSKSKHQESARNAGATIMCVAFPDRFAIEYTFHREFRFEAI